MYKLIKDENKAQGITGAFQAGVNAYDPGDILEQGVVLPWVIDPETSWLEYRCRIDTILDPGTVLHKTLPQTTQTPDTLASAILDSDGHPASTAGVNTTSKNVYSDTVQQMATSTYTFALRGYALRAGYQPTTPGLVSVAGVAAVPTFPQRVEGPEIVAYLSGIPLWFAQWDLWYLVALPPKTAQTPPDNLALHASGVTDLPDGIQIPYSQPGDNDVAQAPGGIGLQGGVVLRPGAQ